MFLESCTDKVCMFVYMRLKGGVVGRGWAANLLINTWEQFNDDCIAG